MARLKCPKCGRKSAYIRYGTKDGRSYKQKQCGSCSYEGRPKYYTRPK